MPELTYIQDKYDERDFKFRLPEVLGQGVLGQMVRKRLGFPRVVDYRSYMSPVKNQGGLGSCVGFAVTALKEFQENVEYINEQNAGSEYTREKPIYDLSEQWAYWNAKKIDPWGPSVEGTSIRYALKVLHKIGLPPEEAWEYTDSNIDIGKPESWSHLIARWNKIESYWRLNSVKHVLEAIRNVGPVVLGVGCFDEIFDPEPDGFVPYPKQSLSCLGGHAILACGYNYNTERVLFKNSWGTGWGAGGYGELGFDYLRDFCWDAWAAKDVNVTKAMLKGKMKL